MIYPTRHPTHHVTETPTVNPTPLVIPASAGMTSVAEMLGGSRFRGNDEYVVHIDTFNLCRNEQLLLVYTIFLSKCAVFNDNNRQQLIAPKTPTTLAPTTGAIAQYSK